MKKGSSKDSVVCLDQYTMKEIGRWPSVKAIIEELGVKSPSLYVALSKSTAIYDCYWVWESKLKDFQPVTKVFRKVRGLHTPEKLQQLIAGNYESQ